MEIWDGLVTFLRNMRPRFSQSGLEAASLCYFFMWHIQILIFADWVYFVEIKYSQVFYNVSVTQGLITLVNVIWPVGIIKKGLFLISILL